jgi:hypothetical protein
MSIELSLFVDVEPNLEIALGCAFVHPDHWWPVSIPQKNFHIRGIKAPETQSYTYDIA